MLIVAYEADVPLVALPLNPVRTRMSKALGAVAATPARRFEPYECPTPTTVEKVGTPLPIEPSRSLPAMVTVAQSGSHLGETSCRHPSDRRTRSL
jgi:hypothetical protein